MARIAAFDPGGEGGDTGIVLIEYTIDQPAHVIDSVAVGDGFTGFSKWYGTIDSDDFIYGTDTYIVEKFVNRNIPGADLTPLLIEGVLRWDLGHKRNTELVLSPASGKNTAVPDFVLKNLDMWFPGDHHHDRREAARHAIRWLKQRKHLPTLKEGWKK